MLVPTQSRDTHEQEEEGAGDTLQAQRLRDRNEHFLRKISMYLYVTTCLHTPLSFQQVRE